LPEPGIQDALVSSYVPPANTLERKLAALWSDILHIQENNISVEADFFEWGGHSLKATILISKINREFQVNIPLEVFFQIPYIRGLGRYLENIESVTHCPVEPAEKRAFYPLFSGQKRLFIFQQLDAGSTAYNITATFILETGVDTSTLQPTFEQLIHRHESLRTSFHIKHNEPVQVIHSQVSFQLEVKNESPVAVEQVDAMVAAFIRPFDLSQAPLMRAGLINLGEMGFLLVVDMHHIISDGISLNILIQDFIALQRREVLSPLRLQYKDFSQWQNLRLNGEVMSKQKEYWLGEFSGSIPYLHLPLDFPRPHVQSYQGASLTFQVEPALVKALETYAREENATLYILLLAVTTVFLGKLSGSEDIVVGTPVAGRSHADLEKIIGMFVNTLALRNYPLENKSFNRFFQEVRERTLQALQNQDYPFDLLAAQVAPQWDTNRNPLFDVMFALQERHVPLPGIANTAATAPGEKTSQAAENRYRKQTSKFDLSIGITVGNPFSINFEYCTHLFKKQSIELFTRYFQEILATVVENRNIRLGDIHLGSAFNEVLATTTLQEISEIDF